MNFNWILVQSTSQLLGTTGWFLDQLKFPSSPGGFLLRKAGHPSLPALEIGVSVSLRRFPPRTGSWGQTLPGLTVTPRPLTLRIWVLPQIPCQNRVQRDRLACHDGQGHSWSVSYSCQVFPASYPHWCRCTRRQIVRCWKGQHHSANARRDNTIPPGTGSPGATTGSSGANTDLSGTKPHTGPPVINQTQDRPEPSLTQDHTALNQMRDRPVPSVTKDRPALNKTQDHLVPNKTPDCPVPT